jgi:hypothetical protein
MDAQARHRRSTPVESGMTIELYPFRYRDPLTWRWVRARFEATMAVMTVRYA